MITAYVNRLHVGDRLHVAFCEGPVKVGEVLIRLRNLGDGCATLILEGESSSVFYTTEKELKAAEEARRNVGG